MPEVGAFRQVDEKHVASEVDLMVWSPKFDLVALSNCQGEVVLHRLCWQKVWSLSPHCEDAKVKAMSWRPDGKVLAVGYNTGIVRLCYIENAEVLHKLEIGSEVTCLSWISQSVSADKTWSCDPYPEDNSDMFLPKLQPLSKSYGSLSTKGSSEESVEDKKKLKSQKELNLLLVGSKSNQLQLYIYGVFPIAKVILGEQGGSEPSAVISAILSEDLNSLVVFIQLGKEEHGELEYSLVTLGKEEHGELEYSLVTISAILSEDLNSLVVFIQLGKEEHRKLEYSLVTFDTTLLASHDKEIHLLAIKYGQIATLIEFDTTLLASYDKEIHLLAIKYGQIATLVEYLLLTIQQMQEAWEDILLEMDSKLYHFAEQKQASGEGTVSNDFLELLLFGTPSLELETFLLKELTDKGLQKLGHSIETSYSNIQKLVVKHLQTVSQGILYHLAEVRGMARCPLKFESLGMDEHSLQKAVMSAGSFVLKTSELQQVIDGSIKNFKAFFRWLYVVIIRLSDEKPPPEFSKMTQHDVNFVADFLRDSFTQFTPKEEEESIADLRAVSPTDKKSGFKLEKVGQYLKKENLPYPPDISGNPWVQFCRASHSLKDSSILYPVENTKSLVQLQENLETTAYSALHTSALKIGESLNAVSSMFLFSSPTREEGDKHFTPKVTQFTAGSPSLVYTVFTTDTSPCDKMYMMTQPTDCQNIQDNVRIICLKFTSLFNKQDPNLSQDSGSSFGRCDNHKILDVAYYDDKLLSVLLVEDTEDQVPVLLQLPLNIISPDNFITMTLNSGVTMTTDIPVMNIGSVEAGLCRRLDNMRAHSFSVSGTRNTATVLFSSRRRVRIFLMDAEEDEDEDDEDEAEMSNQSEADQSGASFHDTSQSGTSCHDNSQSGPSCHDNSQSEVSMQIDGEGEEGQEDKENSSILSGGSA